jgi:hypothetical protein
LAFFLAGGVLAGLGHAMVESEPVLGASGAVAAVSGAYMVLFPLSNVTIVYFFFFIGTFEVSSLWMILLQIGQDAFMYMSRYGGVAYLAHLSGYGFGFVVAMGLLKTRLLPREPYDLLKLMEHRRRRAEFTALTRRGYQPWEGGPPPLARDSSSPIGAQPPPIPDPKRDQLMQLRTRVSEALTAHSLLDAARDYTELLDLDASQVMGQDQQFDLGNQLMAEQRYDYAARAYELYLNTYKTPARRAQVELILALIYARYLNRRQRARELLTAAVQELRDPSQKELAIQLLTEISA